MYSLNNMCRRWGIGRMTGVTLGSIALLIGLDFLLKAVFGGLILVLNCLLFVLIGWWIERQQRILGPRKSSVPEWLWIGLRVGIFLFLFWLLVSHRPLVFFGILGAGIYALVKAVNHDRLGVSGRSF